MEGHSSNVEICLIVEDSVLRVAQVGEHSLFLRDSFQCRPNSEGRIVITVDGLQTTYDVKFDSGITDGAREVRFSDVSNHQHGYTERLLFEDNQVPF